MRQLKIGDKDSYVRVVEDQDVRMFAEVSGDHNPVHLDEEFAKKSMFGRRIAHGMISAGYISTVLGEKIPGEGTIYLGQTLSFRKPVYLGDTITTTAELIEVVNPDKGIYKFKTTCVNQNGEVVTLGEATVMYR